MNLYLMSASEIVRWYEGQTDNEKFLIEKLRELVDEEAENEDLKTEIQHLSEDIESSGERIDDNNNEIRDCISLLRDSSKKDLPNIREEVAKMLEDIISRNTYYL